MSFVIRDFLPGLSSASKGVTHGHSLHLLPRGYTVTLVLRGWACLTSYSHVVYREPGLRGRAPDLLEGSARLLPASGHETPLRNTAGWCR